MANYNLEDLQNHEGVAIIIKDNQGRVLMQDHVKYDFWTVPVGKAKPGESIEDCLCTEAKEELGIDVLTFTELNSFQRMYVRNSANVSVNCHIIEVKSYSGEINNSEPEKHRELRWMSVSDIRRQASLSDATKEYLKITNIF